MKRLIFLVAILAFFGCSAKAQQTLADSITSGGQVRHYNLYIPKNHVAGSSRPLVIHLHGYSSNELLEQIFTNYMAVADTAGFLVAYPRGTTDGFGNQYWNSGIPGLPTTPDDVAFISDLIDSLHMRHNIDRGRVYASGLSNGGYMCYRLAWKLPGKIAAIASVSGSMGPQDFAICNPTQPIPIMEIHGTADTIVPYTGSFRSTDIDSLMRFWVTVDHCLPISDPISVPDIDANDGSNVIHFQWAPELLNMSVELYRINGGGHVDWPGFGKGNNMDFSASPTIWQFFNRFQLTQSSVKDVPIQGSFRFYPNPCSDVLHLSLSAGRSITIVDMTGRISLRSNERDVDVHALNPGCYQLRYEADGTVKTGKLIKF